MSVKLLAGRYELLEKIGDGGMAVVYKARCRLLNRFVAIKILKPEFAKNPDIIESFRRESQAAAGLSHPNIVGIFDVGREGNLHYIVMELIEGQTLSKMIEKEGPIEYHKVIDITKQIASGLSYAHKHHIIHRDIKPHNILMTPDGVAKIADFGIAKAMSESIDDDSEEMVMGSVHYFSPEQARGGYVDEKSDIYSLGIVMYEMLTGRVPFDAETPVQVALMHINEQMVPPSRYVPTIPPRLEAIILKATAKVQVSRYANVDEIIKELDKIELISAVVGEEAVAPEIRKTDRTALDKQKKEAPAEKKKRNKKNSEGNSRKYIIIGAVLLAAVAVIASIFVFGGGKGKVVVPDLRGYTYEEAEQELESLGLEIEKGNEVFSDEYDEGQIVSQSPKPDMEVKKGKSIRVNISKGSGMETVPNVIGMTESQAREALEAKGFQLGRVTEEESSQVAGTVVRQSPVSGTEAESGSAVDIVIAKEVQKQEVAMPGLLGKSLASAQAAIENAGLTVGNVTYAYSSDYPEGQVMEQQYGSGTSLEKGTSVSIVISKGAEPQEPEEPSDNEEDE
ncbi:MAG: Stk1 family PASTA domain-containing Ser/Thr kinase [Anaerovoracaceae bacterium]|nr:Stk1 family PASTA domain-containing Ser/Thr kinase [Anaerovoracaceae bacterium]